MIHEPNCIFCDIASKKLVPAIISESETLIAFKDISPVAPVHVLIVPKVHIRSINQLDHENAGILGDMALMAKSIAKELHVDQIGYRLVLNTERQSGQSVFHLHMHLLAGRDLAWPPG